MSFLRELYYALAVGRMVGMLARERRRRAMAQQEAEARSMMPPPVRPGAPPGKRRNLGPKA